jgi:LytS/YehU family sensor histidine kinase
MYDDPEAADTMISKLSELLRRAMEVDTTVEEVPLSREIDTLELYLDLMRVRFSDRLEVEVEVSPEARVAGVPQLLLQPLVENALRHGAPKPPEPARIGIAAERHGPLLRLTVIDNGPGFADPGAALAGKGIGLPNTASRLRQLHGERGMLAVENRREGGARVTVTLPFAPADETVDAPAAAVQMS